MKKYKKPTQDTPQGTLVYSKLRDKTLDRGRPLKFICISELNSDYPYIIYDNYDNDFTFVDCYSEVFLDEEEEMTKVEKMEFLLERMKDGKKFQIVMEDGEMDLSFSYLFENGELYCEYSDGATNYAKVSVNSLLCRDLYLVE